MITSVFTSSPNVMHGPPAAAACALVAECCSINQSFYQEENECGLILLYRSRGKSRYGFHFHELLRRDQPGHLEHRRRRVGLGEEPRAGGRHLTEAGHIADEHR